MASVAPLRTPTPAPTKVPIPKIGFYGCNDGLVRLSYREPRRIYPKHLTLRCPRCHKTHGAQPLWRKLVLADQGKKATCLD